MKAKKGKSVNDASVQRLNIRVTSEAYERLLVHAIKARVSPGELVTSLIERHCRDWAVRSNHVKANDRLDTAESVNLEAPIAA